MSEEGSSEQDNKIVRLHPDAVYTPEGEEVVRQRDAGSNGMVIEFEDDEGNVTTAQDLEGVTVPPPLPVKSPRWDPMTGLTDRQKAFVQLYCGQCHFSGVEAARLAGYSDPADAAMRAKRHPRIAAAIQAQLDSYAIGAGEILSELANIATAEWKEFLLIRVNPKTGEVMEVKMDLSGKLKALELLGRNRRMFVDNLDVNHGGQVLIRDYQAGKPVERDPAEKDGGGL